MKDFTVEHLIIAEQTSETGPVLELQFPRPVSDVDPS